MRIHASIFEIIILVNIKILCGHCMVIKSNTIIEKMEYSVLVHLQAGTTEIVTLSHYT